MSQNEFLNKEFCVVGTYDATGEVISDLVEAESAFDAFYLSARARDFSSELCLSVAWRTTPAPGEKATPQFTSETNSMGMYASDFEQFSDDMDEKYPTSTKTDFGL